MKPNHFRNLHPLLLSAVLVLLSGCLGKNNVQVTLKNPTRAAASLNATISNIQVINHQIIITGTNLTGISDFKIKEGATTTNLQIESQSNTSIVANTISNVTFAAGKVFDFVLSNASAASTFTVNFSLCDSTLGGKGFDCAIAPQNKYVLTYNAVNQKWQPEALNGLVYVGVADGGALPASGGAGAIGEYYIIGTAGGSYAVGDWAVDNGTVFERVPNPNTAPVLSTFGRVGAVVAAEGDYNLTKLSDVTITAPAADQVLTYNGATWVNGPVVYTETDPNVSAFAKAALPTCGAGQVLKGDGTSLTCVAAAATFSGTANRAVLTDGTGALAVSAVTNTELGYLSGVTSAIQTQLNAKANTSSFVDWAIAGVQTLEPTRLNLTTANRVIVTNAGATPVASAVTSTELGYLTGVTSAIQTQLNAKISTETDPNVSAFAKAALPTCGAGEVLKGNGTSLSCVADSAGSGSYAGGNNLVIVTNGSGALSDSTISTTKLNYLSGVTSDIQTQLNAKQASITAASAITSGSIETNLQAAVSLKPFNTAAGNTGEVRFYELAATGTNYTGFKAPDDLAANLLYVMPSVAPTAGQVLSSDASNNLSWIAIPSAPVSSVYGRTGAVVATAGDYDAAKITNTAAGNIAATNVQTAIDELDTEKQSTASFAADVRALLLTGLSTATNAVITATDSVLGAFGKLQKQITDLDSTKLNKTGGTLSVGTISGVPTPTNSDDVANKGYVDSLGQWIKGTGGNAADIYFSTGKVGIGTTTPNYVLHSAKSGSLNVATENTSATGFAQYLAIVDSAIPIQTVVYSDTTSSAGGVGTNSAHDFILRTNSTEKMRITSAGNVGIGTSTPSGVLDISNDTVHNLVHITPSEGVFGTSSNHPIGLYTNSAKRIHLDTSGNVGIGTTTPTAKLQVSGQIVSSVYNAGTSMAIDWNNGNNQYTAPAGAACGAMTLTNIQDGGTYTLAAQGVTSGTCSFSQAGLTFVYTPANAAVTSDAVYTFLRMGSKVYVSWLTGFQ